MWPFNLKEPKPQQLYRVGPAGPELMPVDDGREFLDIDYSRLCGECSDALKRLRLHHGCAETFKSEIEKGREDKQ